MRALRAAGMRRIVVCACVAVLATPVGSLHVPRNAVYSRRTAIGFGAASLFAMPSTAFAGIAPDAAADTAGLRSQPHVDVQPATGTTRTPADQSPNLGSFS